MLRRMSMETLADEIRRRGVEAYQILEGCQHLRAKLATTDPDRDGACHACTVRVLDLLAGAAR